MIGMLISITSRYMSKKKYISVKKAAEKLEVSPHYVRRLLNDKRIKGDKFTDKGHWRVDSSSLDQYRKTDTYKQDLDSLAKGMKITIKDAVEDGEEIFDADIISYFSIPGAPMSMIDPNDCVFLDDLLTNMTPRKSGTNKFKRILLFLHSSGGILEAAVKFMDILRIYADEVQVVTPMIAKSAATVMALSTDKLYLTSLSELSSVDPIVQSPSNPNLRVPATAIDNFLNYYGDASKRTENSAVENLILKKLEESLDPYLLGSFKGALEYSRQEIRKALENYSMKKKSRELIDNAVDEFTIEHAAHSHPITYLTLKKFEVGQLITDATQSDKARLKVIKTLLAVYQQFMTYNNVVKLIGNRDENKNVIVKQAEKIEQKQIPTRTAT
jgi:excisionase family DNA binding protein